MISVIIPAYNAEKTLARCLESICAQTYRDFEIIVVNDGSTDQTLKIIEETISRLRNREIAIKVVSQENRGVQAARNRGFRELSNPTHPSPGLRPPSPLGRGEGEGQYILFCDADIVLRQDCLEKMVRALEQHPEASYAYSSFKFGWKKFKLWPFSAKRLQKMSYIHTTSLVRFEALDAITDRIRKVRSHQNDTGGAEHSRSEPFDESIKRLQDWDLWLTMLEQGHTGVWIPEVLFRVISTKGTMSQWLPSFTYKIPKWLGIQPQAVARYNEAVERIKEQHKLG